MGGYVSQSKIIHGIDVLAVIGNAEVEVWSGGTSGRANVADDFACLNVITYAHDIVGHMHIYAGIAILMIDNDVITGGAVPGCQGHIAAAAGIDRCALG